MPALATIAADSTYARVARRRASPFTREHPNDWRSCRDMLTADWGYDRYPGVCHIIPNAGVTVMAILYGEGDLPRTVEIATMAGWDTDCNAGNAGAIVGTFQGLQPGWDKYRKPINDFVVASGVIGTINVVDIPTFARELTVLALQLARRRSARALGRGLRASRRALRLRRCPAPRMASAPSRFNQISAQGVVRTPYASLARLARNPARPAGARAGRPHLLEAVLSPLRLRRRALPPDVHAAGRRRPDGEVQALARPVERRRQSARRALCAPRHERHASRRPAPGRCRRADGWQDYELRHPRRRRRGRRRDRHPGRVFRPAEVPRPAVPRRLRGLRARAASPSTPKSRSQEWGGITRFTWNRGHWTLQDGRIHAHTAEDADAWTGNAYLRDVTVTADIEPLAGDVASGRRPRAGHQPLLCCRLPGWPGGDPAPGPRHDNSRPAHPSRSGWVSATRSS